MKGSYEAVVKERMTNRTPKELLGGTFRGRVYPHIFKELKDNFIDETYPTKKCLKGNLTETEIKYHYAEHLNSSQTMCIAYFKKFFESRENELLLAEILLMQRIDVAGCGEFVDAVFEHIPNAKEGTNFDFYLKLANGKQITWEIKFTESEFGGITRNGGLKDKYITKYEQIYIPLLRDCAYCDFPDVDCADYQSLSADILTEDYCVNDKCSIDRFYEQYQIQRNILYAKNKGDYVLFLTPRENHLLDDGRAYIEQYADALGTDCIRNIYWEDLLETTLQVVSCEPELFDYYIKFKAKYFG
ncbi:MAG: hypothetical protein J6A50_05740 [Clostridia bacterium]|nr:hypothetical protein [Clostridia bacterium]